MKKLFSLAVFISSSILIFAQSTNKCSNTVHNTLPPDAPNRSPTECEAQFDYKTRIALRNAFAKTLQNFPEAEWIISDTAIEPLTGVGKGTEQNFFLLSYYFKIDMNPQSKAYAAWYEKYQAAMQSLKAGDEKSYNGFADFGYRMNNALHIGFYIVVNGVSNSIYFKKGGQQTIVVPGATFAIKGPSVAAQSRADDADACLVLFGTQKPVIKKEAGGGASIYQRNNFPGTISHLTVQNIAVRIECNNELLNKIIQDTDWKAIAALTGK